MEHLLGYMFWCIGDFDHCRKCSHHLDILQTETPKTHLPSSNKLGCCRFAGGNFCFPFYIKVVVSQGYTWSVISIGADVFTGITSIYTLAVISLERMFAVGWPLRHRTVNYRVYICAISIPWIIAAIFTTLVVLRILNMIGREHFFYCLVLIPGIPLITICVANFVVWKKQKTPFRSQNHIKREVKLAKTLALITGTSLFTWLPFQIINILFELKVIENFHLFQLTLFIIKTLQFSNSFVNVIIYPFRISEFKRTLFQILNFGLISLNHH